MPEQSKWYFTKPKRPKTQQIFFAKHDVEKQQIGEHVSQLLNNRTWRIDSYRVCVVAKYCEIK